MIATSGVMVGTHSEDEYSLIIQLLHRLTLVTPVTATLTAVASVLDLALDSIVHSLLVFAR